MKTQLSAMAQALLYTFIGATAETFGATTGQMYTASPSIAQTIYDLMVEEADPFLGQLNIVPVSDVQGEKIGLAVSGLVVSRTDTSGNGERAAKNFIDPLDKGYQLYPVDADIAIPYALLNSWSKFPDFQERVNRAIKKAIAMDLIRIGWHGTSAAATTDPSTSPNGEDVNIGWLKQIKDYNAGSQYLAGTVAVPVELGGTLFPNLDSLVHDAVTRLAVYHQDRPDLVALISRDLVNASKGKYYADLGNSAVEKEKIGKIVQTYGGLPSQTPPGFPAGKILVTTLSNLSIYYQETSWRRQQIDEPKKNQLGDYNQRNEGYVVEDFTASSYIDNITIA
jgi:P2 family phage major capsid protein